MRFLVTGANGFVGQYLCAELLRQGQDVRAAVRSARPPIDNMEVAVVGAIDGQINWENVLRDVDVVIHLAARVHVMKDTAADPLAEFLKINLHGTTNLARQAALTGVKRLVYVSSIKVNGELTTGSYAFTGSDKPAPQDPYATSKWQAEQALQQIACETGLEVVIVRPPLIYGPGVKGNFLSLLQVVDRRFPLPFAGVHNVRSLLYLNNFIDILLLCATHSAAAGRIYLLRDGKDISMPELVRQLSEGMGKPTRLFSLPLCLIRGVAAFTGQRGFLERIAGSLRIDDEPIRRELGWEPRFSLQQGLRSTAAWYKEQRHPSFEPLLAKRQHNAVPTCRTSVVIVNYNAGEILLKCVAQALLQAEQVIVVDNASNDGSIAALVKVYPSVVLIPNKHNLGFAKACNRGAQVAKGECILFLNPDCILAANAVARMVQAVHSEPRIGMVGGLLTNPDGSEQGGARRAIPTPWRSFVRAFGFSVLGKRYPRMFSDFALHRRPLPERPIEVEAISGACMLARRDALEDVGLLDEGYFMHCEDLDWCMRFHRKNWKILFVPDARMVHYKGQCSKTRPVFVEWNKHKGMVRFYNKFFRHQYPGLLMGLVVLGVWLRFTAVAGYHLLRYSLCRTRPRRE